MGQNSNTGTKQVTEEIKDITETTGKVTDKVAENLANTAQKFHTKADSAQEFLDEKADVFNEYAHQAIDKANKFGHRAADAINNSSDYITNFDIAETKEKLTQTIKEKPGIGIAAVGIFGILIGLLIGRRFRQN